MTALLGLDSIRILHFVTNHALAGAASACLLFVSVCLYDFIAREK